MDFGAAGIAVILFAFGAGVLVTRLFSPAKRQAAELIEAKPVEQDMLASGILETMPVPLIVIDRRGAVVRTNQTAVETFGLLPAGTLLFLKFRSPDFRSAIEGAIKGGMKASFDIIERAPVEQWFRVDIAPLPGDGENERFFALFLRDRSEQHRLDQMRSDFVANASHELRTPLASMTGFIETLKGPARNDAGARDKFLDIMQQQGARMARLIDDLLSLSRLEMRPVVSLDKMVDLRIISDDVIDALKPLAAELGVVIEKSYRFEDGFPVAGVRDELIQVAENLIENACKYGQSGRRIVVSIRTDGKDTLFAVQDFGPGIPAEHIPRLTERFYRVDVGASRAQKGTGLGLAIVKHILTRHRASLRIVSKLGEGAQFIVNFPTPASVAKPDGYGLKSIISDS
jgi:two-component system, OmpR family, phosphate regulon sensor histidine kinase PhoR